MRNSLTAKKIYRMFKGGATAEVLESKKIKEAFSQTAKDIKTKPLSTVNPLKKTGIVGNFLRRNFGRITAGKSYRGHG